MDLKPSLFEMEGGGLIISMEVARIIAITRLQTAHLGTVGVRMAANLMVEVQQILFAWLRHSRQRLRQSRS